MDDGSQLRLELCIDDVNTLSDHRHTEILHTFAHENCPACEATRALMTIDPDQLRSLRYIDASQIWLQSRKQYLKKRTYELYEQHVKQTSVFFGEMRVKTIHIGHVREYQKARLSNDCKRWAKVAGPSLINHELVTLKGILERAGEWEKIKPHYEALPLPSWKPPKAMTDEEEMVLFAIAREDPSLEIALIAFTLTLNTGGAGTELRHIQIGDIHLEGRRPMFFIKGETAKNEFRGRPIILNVTAENAIRRALQIAKSRGCYLPEHYLFCKRDDVTRKWLPKEPATESWLRRACEKIRTRTGFKWFTPHCMRHHHITLRLDAGEPIESVRQDVGHQDVRMTRWYYHARGDRQQAAVDAIDPLVRFGKKQSEASPPRGKVVQMRAR